jgi:hypothetical protein
MLMTHEEAVNCKDVSHVRGDKHHSSGNHCAPCCDSLRIYGKVLDAVAGQHRLESLREERKAVREQIEEYKLKKDHTMVANQSEYLKKLNKRIEELEATIGSTK